MRLGVGHHRLAPRAKVLDPTDAHVGVVDVDPVVGEEVVAADDERDRQEVAVAQARRGRQHRGRRRRVGDRDDVAQRQRRDHVLDLEALAAGVQRAHAPAVELDPHDLGASRSSPASPTISVAIASHICPGPRRG